MRMRKKKNRSPMERCGDRLIRSPTPCRSRADALTKELRLSWLWQRPLHRRYSGCAGAGRAVHRYGAGVAVCNGRGHGAVRARAPPTCSSSTPLLTSCPCSLPRERRTGSISLSAILAQQPPRQAPPDPRQLPAAVPPGAEDGRADPLQDGQSGPLHLLRGGAASVRLCLSRVTQDLMQIAR